MRTFTMKFPFHIHRSSVSIFFRSHTGNECNGGYSISNRRCRMKRPRQNNHFNGFIDGKLSTVAILNHDNVQNCYYKLYTHYQVFKSPFFQILLTADCDTLECRLHVVCSSNGTRFFKWFSMLYGYWWNITR